MTRSGGRRGISWLAAGAAAGFAALALVPASASGVITVFLAYKDLAPGFKPAPLVAMTFPPALGPLGEIEVDNAIEGHGRYGLLLSRVTPAKHPGALPRTAANLLIRGYGAVPLRKEAHLAKALYHVSSTTVRGHRGVLIRGKHKPTIGLIWSEGGGLYGLATGTPKTVSVADLGRTASGMDRIVGLFQGETPEEHGFSAKGLGMQSRGVLGEHAAVVEVSWQAECQAVPGSEFGSVGGGKATVTLPVTGGAAAFGPAPVLAESLIEGETAAWTLGVSGSLAAAGGQLTETASGSSDGRSCAIGPQSFPLTPFHER